MHNSGHHKELAYCKEKVDQMGAVSAECKRCDTKETDDVINSLTKCPQAGINSTSTDFRYPHSGCDGIGNPHRIIRLAERTLTL